MALPKKVRKNENERARATLAVMALAWLRDSDVIQYDSCHARQTAIWQKCPELKLQLAK